MKHFSKQLSWLLAFVLIFTSIVSTGIPVFAADETITLDESTNKVIVNGTQVNLDPYSAYYGLIRYFDSADSTDSKYEANIYSGYPAPIAYSNSEISPNAWYVEYIESKSSPAHSDATVAYFNAYPANITIDIPDQAHTGSEITPPPVVKCDDQTLVQGIDYNTVAYTNNIDVGEATVTVTLAGSYAGTMTKKFNIASSKLVSFDENGGTGTMSAVHVIAGGQYTLPACTFTAPANKEFKAWKIGGTEYAAGANYTVTNDTTAIAVWRDLEIVKTPGISPNGGTFRGSQTVTIISEPSDAIIYYTTDGTEPTTGSTVYSGPFTISGSLTVKAFAVKDGMVNSGVASASFTKSSSSSGGSKSNGSTTPTVAVKFNTDGGSTVGIKNIKKGSKIGEIPAPTKEGYVFAGWYSDEKITKAYDANTIITESTTLYANWTKVELDPADNSNHELVLTIGKKEAEIFGSKKTNDVPPIIKNNRTMLPGRFVAESLGAEVAWDGKKQEVAIKGKNEKGEDITILLYIGSDIALVNGKEVKLDSPAFIQSGRTYAPIRFIAERLGAKVDWVQADKKVVITKKTTN